MKADCGWLFSEMERQKKTFARSIREHQPPSACCIFCIIETRSGTAEAMGSVTLNLNSLVLVSMSHLSVTQDHCAANSWAPALQPLACHKVSSFFPLGILCCFKLTTHVGSGSSSVSGSLAAICDCSVVSCGSYISPSMLFYSEAFKTKDKAPKLLSQSILIKVLQEAGDTDPTK